MADTGLGGIYRFFAGDDKSYTLAKFRKEWAELSDSDKAQIKAGIADGTLNY